MVVPVRVKDQRALAGFSFQAVGVKFGLLTALFGIAAGALRLYHGKRLRVVAPQHVVRVAHAFAVGHAVDFVLGIPTRPVHIPAGFFQKQVDEGIASLGLVVVVGVWRNLVGGARRDNLGA